MDKSSLRAEYTGVEITSSESVAEGLFTWLSRRLPGTITTFKGLADEVDIWPLVDRLPGWRWVLPRIEPEGVMTWRDAHVDFETYHWGISQPVESAPIVPRHELDYLLVPGVVFDVKGRRLGRGKGFYDIELANIRPDALTVGVTVESRLVDRVPTDEHDQTVAYIATELGVRETSR